MPLTDYIVEDGGQESPSLRDFIATEPVEVGSWEKEYFEKKLSTEVGHARKILPQLATAAKLGGGALFQVPGLAEDFAAATVGQGADVLSAAVRPFNDAKADELTRTARAFEKVAAEQDSPAPDFLRRGARGAWRQAAPAMVAGALTGGVGAIGYGSAQETNQAITEGRDAGLSGKALERYVIAQGGLEGIIAGAFQATGFGGLEAAFAKRAFRGGVLNGLKQVGKDLAAEEIEELLTASAQHLNGHMAGVNPEAMTIESWAQLGLDTVTQTAMLTGPISGASIASGQSQRAGRMANVQQGRQQQPAPSPVSTFGTAPGLPFTAPPSQQQVERGEAQQAALNIITPETVTQVVGDFRASGREAQLIDLAAKENPSRQDWDAAGLSPILRNSGPVRKKFTSVLRQTLQSQPQQQPQTGEILGTPQPSESQETQASEPPNAQQTQETEKAGQETGQTLDPSGQLQRLQTEGVLESGVQLGEVQQIPPKGQYQAPPDSLADPPDRPPNATGGPPATPPEIPAAGPFAPPAARQRPASGPTGDSGGPLAPPATAPIQPPPESGTTKLAPKVKAGRIGYLSKGQVAKVFPGSTITPTEHGWQVALGDSFIDVAHTEQGEIPFDREMAERQYGRKIEPDEEPLGRFSLFIDRDKTGSDIGQVKAHTGYGLILMRKGMSEGQGDMKLSHEAVHLARKARIWTEGEWAKLRGRFSSPDRTNDQAEEDVAAAREVFKYEPKLIQRLRDWIDRVLQAIFGITPSSADAIMNRMNDPSFWNRPGMNWLREMQEGKRSGPPMPGEKPGAYNKPPPRRRAEESADANAMRWFLKSRNVIEEKMPAKAMPSQVLSTLKNNGISEEELEWTGLAELLGGKTSPKMVTKEQVLEALAGAVQVEEVEKGKPAKDSRATRLSEAGITPQEWASLTAEIDRLEAADYDLSDHEVARYNELISQFHDLGGHQADRPLGNPDLDWTPTTPTASGRQVLQATGYGGEAWTITERPDGEFTLRQEDELVEIYPTIQAAQAGAVNEGATPPPPNATKFRQYQMPGGENYRELLLKLPMQEKLLKDYQKQGMASEAGVRLAQYEAFRSSHWDEPNVLAHIRLNDRTGPNGEKVLFLEELQSDWHQQGRKRGYKGEGKRDEIGRQIDENIAKQTEIIDAFGDDLEKLNNKVRGGVFESPTAEWNDRNVLNQMFQVWNKIQRGEKAGEVLNQQSEHMQEKYGEPIARYDALIAEHDTARQEFDRLKEGIPDAPYKKTWPALALRRMIQYAVDGGYQRLAWTPGSVQADRYDLSKQVDKIAWHHPPRPPLGARDILITLKQATRDGQTVMDLSVGPDGNVVRSPDDSSLIGKPLDEVIGKEIAKKIMEDDGGQLSGEGLRIGGEGMKGFYDKILPAEANKIIKKYGVKTSIAQIPYKDPGYANREGDYADEGVIPAHGFDITDSMKEAAQKYGQPMYAIGRPEVANPSTVGMGRQAVDEGDEALKGTKAAKQAEEEVKKEALDELEADWDGVKAKVLKSAQAGPLNAKETYQAVRIVDTMAVETAVGGDPRTAAEFLTFLSAYRDSGSGWSDAGRARRDQVMGLAERMRIDVAKALFEPPPHVHKAVKAARQAGDSAAIFEIGKQWAEKIKAIKAELLKLGVDIDDLNKWGYSPRRAWEVLAAVQPMKGTFVSMMEEYYRFALLSGPKTNIVNAASGGLHAAYHYAFERVLSSTMNSLGGKYVADKDGPTLAEFPYIARGFLPGLAEGFRHMKSTFRYEVPTFDLQFITSTRKQLRQIELTGGAIPSAKFKVGGKRYQIGGKQLRWPMRAMLAADQFIQAWVGHMEVSAQAYRIAKSEGRSGEDLSNRMAELSGDIDSDAWHQAYLRSLDITFKQPGSKATRTFKNWALEFRDDHPWSFPIIPFIVTPANIFETGVKKSLFPLPITLGKAIANVYNGRPALQGLSGDAAPQIIALATLIAIMGSNDEDDPWITGAEAQLSEQGRVTAQRMRRPHQSIRFMGKWRSYARIEPFASILAPMVDFSNHIKARRMGKAAASPIVSMSASLMDKTFTSGIGDILDAIEQERAAIGHKGETGAGGAKWLSNFAVSWIPNAIRATGRAADSEIQQRAVWGDSDQWIGMVWDRTLQRSELPGIAGSVPSYPVYDAWGRVVPTPVSFIPRTDFPLRLVSPLDSQKEEVLPGDRLLLNWNMKHAGEEKYFGRTPRWYKVDGETKYYTDAQYAQYTKLAGEVARKLVDSETGWSIENPSEADADRVVQIVADARDIARDQLISEWNARAPSQRMEVLASRERLRNMGEPTPLVVPKAQKAKGITLSQYQTAHKNQVSSGIKYLRDNRISAEAAENHLKTITSHLEPENQARIIGRFRARLDSAR